MFQNLRMIHLIHRRRNLFQEMCPALKAHHDTPTLCGLSPRQIRLGRDLLGR